MKLKALDQIHVSSVKPDSLRPGEEFEVSDEAGKALVASHPAKFRVLEDRAEKAEAAPLNKAETAPPNKAEPTIKQAPATKPAKPPRTKRGK